MDEYIDVRIDVFEHLAQRARLRKALTVEALVDEILKEFDDISADSPGKYALYLKGSERALNPASTLIQLDIQPQDELVFNYVRQTIRQMLDARNYAFLRDEATNRMYDIQWQPAIIGRPTNEADHNINLAVNLQLHPKGQTVSRRHAQITFTGGRFFIEALAENNPVFINGRQAPFGAPQEIKNGDRLVVGRNELVLNFMTQAAPASAVAAQASRSGPALASMSPASAASAPVAAPRESLGSMAQPSMDAEEGRTFIGANQVGARAANLIIERATDMGKAGQRLALANYPYLLGRDLPLLGGENEVSRRHAEIYFDAQNNKYFVTDLHSTNGVTLEGTRIEPNRPYEIRPGMRIGLGQKLLLRLDA